MKYFILFSVFFVMNNISSQTIDSITIKLEIDSLVKLGQASSAQKNFDLARSQFNQACTVSKKQFGENSIIYATCSINLAGAEKGLKNFKVADDIYKKSILILKEQEGIQHPNYSKALMNQAELYIAILEFQKAEEKLLEAIGIRKEVFGKDSDLYLNGISKLAILYRDMGRYDEAEPLYLIVVKGREKQSGNQSIDYASALNNLGNFYWRMGRFSKAEQIHLTALSIRLNKLGINHPDYASSLNNLGLIYVALGEFEKASPYYHESIKIRESKLGKNHPDYATGLMNYAILCKNIGSYKKAEQLHLEAKSILLASEGDKSLNYLKNLSNLAIVYIHDNRITEAKNLLENVTYSLKANLGEEHLEYLIPFHTLTDIYLEEKEYEKASQNYLYLKEKFFKLFGTDNAFYSTTLTNLGITYDRLLQFDLAEKELSEAVEINQKCFGKSSPIYLDSKQNLTLHHWSIGNTKLAQEFFLEMNTLQFNQIDRAKLHLTEKELFEFLTTFKLKNDILNTFICSNKDSFDQLGSVSFNNELYYKGFLLNTIARFKSIISQDSSYHTIYSDYCDVHRQLIIEYSKPLSERRNTKSLESESQNIERSLLNLISHEQDYLKLTKFEEVKKNLSPTDAVIEFTHFQWSFLNRIDSTIYVAIILKKGDNQPHFIPLFEEKSLDSLLYTKSDRKSDYVNSLYSLADRGAIAIEAPKKSLFDLIWKPIEKELIGIKTVYYSPSGLLHRINLDAVPISETETLADKYQLIAVNSTRQLVIPDQVKIVNNNAVLYGGILYEQDSILEAKEPLFVNRTRSNVTFSSIDSTLRGGIWNFLAGSEREVNSIEKTMQSVGVKTNLKKGYFATEASFKNIGVNNTPSPRILHIATHGYFFEDPKSNTKQTVSSSHTESVFKMSDHPMLRSGLIMAGGNAAWQGKQTMEGREDGILTAYEISQMNLTNTELVVLSACETGLGDIQGNEGVYGLQRAFRIAGAKYLIMSLWQVPDKQTSLLMTTFYKKWLEEKLSIPNAFHAAQKQLRDGGLEPYYWAGFVLVE
ncbi:MAG: CHAT domain-containing protein [Saprospiraceae bacterium]|nr:CHAT domain-containing protein [Candidatus Defluviibacterium haderslevense]